MVTVIHKTKCCTVSGLFMALQPRIIACGPKMAAISMAIRFLGGPVVMSAASMAVELRGVKFHTAIVQVCSTPAIAAQ